MTAETPGEASPASSNVDGRRSSPGGHAVASSLAAAGYVHDPSVGLVETARPRLRGHAALLSQNAWNFIPAAEFGVLASPYDARRRLLYRARRAVAHLNSSRTDLNVVLSDYMADLLRSRGVDATMVPVTVPWDLCDESLPTPSPVAGVDRPFVLLPGVLSWYKNDDFAFDLLAHLPPEERPLVVLAGTDDGSGYQAHLRDRAQAARQACWLGAVSRGEMTWLLQHALATIIPSRLESLSFSLAEALILSPRVLASPLAVHVEVAKRLGRTPHWISPHRDAETVHALLEPADAPPPIARAPFRQEWLTLAAFLNDEVGRTT